MRLGSIRRNLYRAARVLGDVQAVTSGDSSKIAKRFINKIVGKSLIRRLWLK